MVTNDTEFKLTTFYGLSTDEKPKAENGSCFIEIDTGDAYFYDAAGAQWRKA